MLEVPETIIAAISASVVTLIGVLYTVHKSFTQQRTQLKHDAKERERERQMNLRRGVYLPAIANLSSNLSSILSMANLELPNEQVINSKENAQELSQIQIVGRDAVVQAVNRYSLELTEALLKLFIERAKLLDLKNSLELANEYMDRSLTKQSEYIEMMTQFNLQGSTDHALWNRIDRQAQFYNEQVEKYRNERNEVSECLRRQHIDFFEVCAKRLTKVSDLVPPIVFAIREELDLPLDRETFLKDHSESVNRIKEMLCSFKDAVSEHVIKEH